VARHRSPSGARSVPAPDVPTRTEGIRGTHRLPAPPAASLRGRATIAAVAAGAVVAAGQSVVSQAGAGAVDVEPAVAGALLPVAAVAAEDPTSAVVAQADAADAIGGDQLPADAFTVPALDADSQVDVQSLAKAVDIGRELAQRAAILDSALSFGAPEAVLVGDTAFVRPVSGRLTSGFGARWGTSHRGIDIANSIGTPIYAVTDGVVAESGPASGFGMWVVLRHSDGTKSVYGHINRSFVEVGQRVAAGERIAEVGNRGFSTGPHLHFEVWDVDGTKLNPMTWLQRHGISF
jgi:murein DD-endopeptidase MepM/ murein hydrolase activator NlpD